MEYHVADTAHSLYVGSYGRNTAIDGFSDLDVLMQLPYDVYKQYDAHDGNGQSALLQGVKTSIEKTYSTTSIKAGGRVILVPFDDSITFEVVPALLIKTTATLFPTPKTAETGRPPIRNLRSGRSDPATSPATTTSFLCAAWRAWKNQWNVPIGGLLIDTLAYQFIGNYQYRDKSYLYYDYLCRDFFKWMADQDENQEWWRAPGSGQWVYGKGLFQYKAKRVYNLALEAIADETSTPKKEGMVGEAEVESALEQHSQTDDTPQSRSILEGQLREQYGRVVYSHKTYEKGADILILRHDCIRL